MSPVCDVTVLLWEPRHGNFSGPESRFSVGIHGCFIYMKGFIITSSLINLSIVPIEVPCLIWCQPAPPRFLIVTHLANSESSASIGQLLAISNIEKVSVSLHTDWPSHSRLLKTNLTAECLSWRRGGGSVRHAAHLQPAARPHHSSTGWFDNRSWKSH